MFVKSKEGGSLGQLNIHTYIVEATNIKPMLSAKTKEDDSIVQVTT